MSERHRLYINGEWCDGSTGEQVGIVDPATEEVIEEIPYGGRQDVASALSAAGAAFESWRRLTPYERAEVLRATAGLIREGGTEGLEAYLETKYVSVALRR